MYKLTFVAAVLTAICSACNAPEAKQPILRLQIKIAGTGMANTQIQVYSKGKQEFLMFGDAAQEMRFQNADTINCLFPLGVKDASGHLDTTAIKRGAKLSFNFLIKEYRTAKTNKRNEKPSLHITLLANGKDISSVKLPAMQATIGKASAAD